jgi:phosphoglycolate phosphatase-like HAD superfamily hydrolase
MRYRCLILDHDDTSVRSTPEIHYPAHLEVMRQLRPDWEPATLEEWLIKNFSPGIMSYMTEELGFSEEEVDMEYRIWRTHTEKVVPSFFPGFLEILKDFKSEGGIITVVSHSEEDLIRRDYAQADAPHLPELIFGWDKEKEKRKPSPYPVQQILAAYKLSPEEALIVDDLKPAVEMSRQSGVAIAGAGWGHDIPLIREYMKANCEAYFDTIEEFRTFLFA